MSSDTEEKDSVQDNLQQNEVQVAQQQSVGRGQASNPPNHQFHRAGGDQYENCFPLSLDSLAFLAWTVATDAATTPQDFLVKAQILIQLLEEGDEDIVSVLSHSLCQDILRAQPGEM